MAVPYTFAGATSAIPLSQLDTNFATTFTLGNTAIQLGNTVTTLNNMTLANVTISSGNVTITNVSVTTANVTTGNITTLTSTNATITNMSSGNVTITGGTINGTTLGATTASSANVTTLTTSSTVTLNGGTANGIAYLNGSKVLTTGSALTFDGTNLTVPAEVYRNSDSSYLRLAGGNPAATGATVLMFGSTHATNPNRLSLTAPGATATSYIDFNATGAEGMRLTSSGLEIKQSQLIGYSSYAGIGTNGLAVAGNVGIGTSSPAYKLDVGGSTSGGIAARINNTDATGYSQLYLSNSGTSGRSYLLSVGGNGAGAGFANNFYIYDVNAAATRLTLDSSGNLGLGVTPSAWSVIRAIDIGSGANAAIGSNDGGAYLTLNSFFNGSVFKYKITGFASYYSQVAGAHAWYTAPSGTAGNTISFTQAMTLDTDGELGVGTTNPAARVHAYSGTAMKQLTVDGVGAIKTGINFANGGTTYGQIYFDNNAPYDMSVVQQYTTGSLIFGTNSTERARITSGGDLLVGTSSGQVAATVVAYRASAATSCVGAWSAATSGDNLFIDFYTEATATLRGSIDYNRAGGLTRYNITSDYRAKDIIGPAKNTGATIDALKVYEGVMKGATQPRPMMIAHEAQAVVPFCVSGTKDETNEDGTPKYQQMDHASLVPLLIAELQSLRARVAALEIK